MKYINLFILCINIFTVFGLPNAGNFEDCISLNNFFESVNINNGQKLKFPVCCDNSNQFHYIRCENGFVTEIDLRMNSTGDAIFDFSNFPMLTRLNKFVIEGGTIKDGILPERFFELPNLIDLEVKSSNIATIPENLNKNCPLQKLSLFNNQITGFPEQLMEFKKLKYLNISRNERIRSIPSSISNLKDLEILYVGMTGLTSLSEELFKLTKLKELDLDGNERLYTRILNFGNSSVGECDFRNTNILCYEPGTCEKLIMNQNPKQYNFEPDTLYPSCNSSRALGSSFFNGTNSNKNIFSNINLILVAIIFIMLGVFYYSHRNTKKDIESKGRNSLRSNMVVNLDENDMKEDIYVTPMPLSQYIKDNVKKAEAESIALGLVGVDVKFDSELHPNLTLKNNSIRSSNTYNTFTTYTSSSSTAHLLNTTTTTNNNINNINNNKSNKSIKKLEVYKEKLIKDGSDGSLPPYSEFTQCSIDFHSKIPYRQNTTLSSVSPNNVEYRINNNINIKINDFNPLTNTIDITSLSVPENYASTSGPSSLPSYSQLPSSTIEKNNNIMVKQNLAFNFKQ
eukprot:jgi/Orpsp1_1/1175492/evm.model.c7180000054083.1